MSEKQDTLQISIRHDVTGYPSFVIHGLCGEQKHDEALLESYRKLFESAPVLLEVCKKSMDFANSDYVPNALFARIKAAIALAQGA